MSLFKQKKQFYSNKINEIFGINKDNTNNNKDTYDETTTITTNKYAKNITTVFTEFQGIYIKLLPYLDINDTSNIILDTSNVEQNVEQIYKTLNSSNGIFTDHGKKMINNLYEQFTSSDNEQDKIVKLSKFKSYLQKSCEIVELSLPLNYDINYNIQNIDNSNINVDGSNIIVDGSNIIVDGSNIEIVSQKKSKIFTMLDCITNNFETKFLSMFSSLSKSVLADKIPNLPKDKDVSQFVETEYSNIFEPTEWANLHLDPKYVKELDNCSRKYKEMLENKVKKLNGIIEIMKITDKNKLEKLKEDKKGEKNTVKIIKQWSQSITPPKTSGRNRTNIEKGNESIPDKNVDNFNTIADEEEKKNHYEMKQFEIFKDNMVNNDIITDKIKQYIKNVKEFTEYNYIPQTFIQRELYRIYNNLNNEDKEPKKPKKSITSSIKTVVKKATSRIKLSISNDESKYNEAVNKLNKEFHKLYKKKYDLIYDDLTSLEDNISESKKKINKINENMSNIVTREIDIKTIYKSVTSSINNIIKPISVMISKIRPITADTEISSQSSNKMKPTIGGKHTKKIKKYKKKYNYKTKKKNHKIYKKKSRKRIIIKNNKKKKSKKFQRNKKNKI
tara:strand:- start:53 stop:1900 length:1848 start_codon:yes stop_codon:yes gene_type:complete